MRYARHITLPQIGPAGQSRLEACHALVIGLGGLGSPASLYLANAGVGQLTLNDHDRVDETNLPRQILFGTQDIGVAKTSAAAASLNRSNPAVSTNELEGRLTERQLTDAVAAADVVLDCTDNFSSRTLINQVCAQQKTTLITGAAIRFEGQLSVFDFSREPQPCYSCLYAAEDENFGDCAGQGILAPVVGTIGCMMATEALKALLGLASDLQGKVWIYDALSGSSRTLNIPARDDCPVCA